MKVYALFCVMEHTRYRPFVAGEVHVRNLGEPKFLNRRNSPYENTTTILDYTGFRSKGRA